MFRFESQSNFVARLKIQIQSIPDSSRIPRFDFCLRTSRFDFPSEFKFGLVHNKAIHSCHGSQNLIQDSIRDQKFQNPAIRI
jgi:hypothetical protein